METARRRRRNFESINPGHNRNTMTGADRSEVQPSHDDIARRAYELYERRGGEHGHDWDDWLLAEDELRSARRHEKVAAAMSEKEESLAAV